MLVALALLLQSAAPATTPEIVVTGERLKKVYEECRAGKCTPLRDAQASIAWAETLFREGKYIDAKRVLRNAASRNRQHAATQPRAVSALYEAFATVSWQEGDQDAYRQGTIWQIRTLRDNLPPDDPAVKAAALALGDMWVRLGNANEAERTYLAAEREGVAAGQAGVALRARLARARLRHARGDRKEAKALIESAFTMRGAEHPATQAAIRVVALRLEAADGEEVATDRLVSELAGMSLDRPVLLFSPPYPTTPLALATASRRLNELQLDEKVAAADSGAAEYIRWADIGFWIRPDGSVAEAEVLRGSRLRDWTAPYLDQVSRRRYSAIAGSREGLGVYRVERFTLRGNYLTPAGSLIRRRGGAPDLEVLDLTDPNAKVTAPRGP